MPASSLSDDEGRWAYLPLSGDNLLSHEYDLLAYGHGQLDYVHGQPAYGHGRLAYGHDHSLPPDLQAFKNIFKKKEALWEEHETKHNDDSMLQCCQSITAKLLHIDLYAE
jgi:hypothetical protein